MSKLLTLEQCRTLCKVILPEFVRIHGARARLVKNSWYYDDVTTIMFVPRFTLDGKPYVWYTSSTDSWMYQRKAITITTEEDWLRYNQFWWDINNNLNH